MLACWLVPRLARWWACLLVGWLAAWWAGWCDLSTQNSFLSNTLVHLNFQFTSPSQNSSHRHLKYTYPGILRKFPSLHTKKWCPKHVRPGPQVYLFASCQIRSGPNTQRCDLDGHSHLKSRRSGRKPTKWSQADTATQPFVELPQADRERTDRICTRTSNALKRTICARRCTIRAGTVLGRAPLGMTPQPSS